VDSEAELQYVDDPELLPVAAGSLGLLGITTAITYKVFMMFSGSFENYLQNISFFMYILFKNAIFLSNV
jgi:hypothetical protein